MKKKNMIKMAIVGLMAGASALNAQNMSQNSPQGSCGGSNPRTPNNGNNSYNTNPNGNSCHAKNGNNNGNGYNNNNGNGYNSNGNGNNNNSNGYNNNSATQMPPSSSCGNSYAQNSKRGVDTSVHSNYSNSNEKKASANRSFEGSCGDGSCSGNPPPPQPGSNPSTARKSTLK